MNLASIPRYPLGCLPTPIQYLPNLSKKLGINLSIKRDDLTGLAAGGNKVRKLEYLVAEARELQSTTLITAGALQSNHVLQTIAAARKSGMEAVAVLDGARPEQFRGNLVFDQLLGARLEFLQSGSFVEDVVGYMDSRREQLRLEGESPYVVPVGGSNALGACGYVNCALEMAEQFESRREPAPDYLVVATGSVGTYAGLVVGCAQYWPDTKICGVVVTTNYFARRENVVSLVNQVAEKVAMDRRWDASELWLDSDYIGPGYGIRSPAGDAAIALMAESEGIFLDPTYTGKVFSGLVGNVRAGCIPAGSSVLFVHTGGATALLS